MLAVRRVATAHRLTNVLRMCTLASASVLPSKPLAYRGVLIEVASAEQAAAVSAERLQSSIEHWRSLGHKSCMLKLSIEHSHVASLASGLGFEFHHAEKNMCVLKKWLQPELEDKVPPFATHQVGVAGLCIDEQGRILLVKEWRDVPAAEGGGRVPSAQWKLPGGLLDRGESFGEAAIREVFEETGIRTRFRSVLSFWHRHGLAWGQSDLYYVIRLELEDGERGIPTAQPDEISDVTWMEVDEFLATQDHPLVSAVLSRIYGLRTDGARGREKEANVAAPQPLVEMSEGAVQWPGREPYPTYFGKSSATAT